MNKIFDNPYMRGIPGRWYKFTVTNQADDAWVIKNADSIFSDFAYYIAAEAVNNGTEFVVAIPLNFCILDVKTTIATNSDFRENGGAFTWNPVASEEIEENAHLLDVMLSTSFYPAYPGKAEIDVYVYGYNKTLANEE